MSEEVKDEIAEAIEKETEDVVLDETTEEVVDETVAEEVVEEPAEEENLSLEDLFDLASKPADEPVEEVVEEEVKEEVVEEPELPEYTKLVDGEIDLTSDMEVEAINYWGGGPKADWTKHPEQMSDEQKAVFGKHQAAYDKSKVAPAVAKEEYNKDEMSEAVADLAKLIKGDPETKQKYMPSVEAVEAPKEDNRMKEFLDALDSDNREVAMKTFADILSAERERAIADATAKAREAALQDVRSNSERAERDGWIMKVAEENRQLEETQGSAYTQYKEQIQRILELTDEGIPNPLTGTHIRSVKEAYDLARRMDSGGGKRVASVRPSPVVSPPAGSGEGSGPEFTDKDYSGDSKSFMEKAWETVHK